MYRHGIPLLPSEELGYHFGLVVPPEFKRLYYKPRVSKTQPPSGYGTQVNYPRYGLNKAFAKLGIPLKFSPIWADKIKDAKDLVEKLSNIERNDGDALLLFNYSVAHKNPYKIGGHAVVFDRVVKGKIRVIDAWYENPKWQLVEPELLYKAIAKHGVENSGGIWEFKCGIITK
jgi:hypothetical protein